MRVSRVPGHLRRGVLVLSATLVGCGLLGPDEERLEEGPVPGILSIGDLPLHISHPSEGSVGEDVIVQVWTLTPGIRSGPCSQVRRDLRGPHETLVSVTGEAAVEIRPIDLLAPFENPYPPSMECIGIMGSFLHRVVFVPPSAGTLIIRIFGRSLRFGDEIDAPGEPMVVERFVAVHDPEGP